MSGQNVDSTPSSVSDEVTGSWIVASGKATSVYPSIFIGKYNNATGYYTNSEKPKSITK